MRDTIGVGIFRFTVNAIGKIIGWAAVIVLIPGLALLGVALAVCAAGDELCAWSRSL